ncbi:unnamed protein product [Ascophyllum nodosum]
MLNRQLEAITISERVMDADMRTALAGELHGVEEGSLVDENNLLDDDFVVQAAGADDDEGAFDFDAHVARLMEASARETGLRARTAADDLETKGLARLRKGGDLSSDASSDLEAESDGSGEFDEAMLEGLDLNEGQGDRRDVGVLGEGTEERTLLDSQFEATLKAYDSDEWGELEEDDERVQGQWDPEQHKYANRCMDDFLANKEDASWVDGIKRLPPEQRGIAIETLGEDADQVEENEEDVFEEIGRHNEYLRERQVQGADDSYVQCFGFEVNLPYAGIGPKLLGSSDLGAERWKVCISAVQSATDHGGRRHVQKHAAFEQLLPCPEQWDCETIISTYSNLDNHPSVLGTGRKAKPRKPRGPLAVKNAGGVSGAADGLTSTVKKVVLSEKTGMPLGVLPERVPNDKGMILLTAGKNVGEKRVAEETVEEKRLRKAKIKQEKRDKRVQKKGVKVAFVAEAKVVKHALANPEAPQNRSVFTYS